jgi:hypothetical protein
MKFRVGVTYKKLSSTFDFRENRYRRHLFLTGGRERISVRNLHSWWPIWAKFEVERLHLMPLSAVEFRENLFA